MNQAERIQVEEFDESGVHARLPTSRAQRLVARWASLQPTANGQPDAVRTLKQEVGALLELCMSQLMAFGHDADPTTHAIESDALLDASYVLERLEWCILHNAPYVDRPRVAELA